MDYGTKYDRDMTGAQIAAAIRADIKAAVAAGDLPRAKYSARLKTYSGGQSISITFANVPFDLFDRDFLRHRLEDDRGHWDGERFSEAHRVLLHRLEQLGDAYNYDGSRIEEDYFNVNYYLHVSAESSYASERARVELEAVRAELEPRNARRPRRGAPSHEIDYDQNLDEQVAIARFYSQPDRAQAFEAQGNPIAQLVYLARLVDALDHWIMQGGALPERWANALAAHGTRNARVALAYAVNEPIFWPPRLAAGGVR